MEVSEDHFEQLREVFSGRPEVVAVYLFGSHARAEAGPLSDVDIGVLVDESNLAGKSLSDYRLDYIGIVMEVFQSDDIDAQVVSSESAYAFAYNVISEGKLILSNNESERIDREVRIINNYLDFLPFEKLYDEFMYKKIKEGTYGIASI